MQNTGFGVKLESCVLYVLVLLPAANSSCYHGRRGCLYSQDFVCRCSGGSHQSSEKLVLSNSARRFPRSCLRT
ncbi:hypothetical protein B0T12DRAFT_421971 [Alternaria alternata]|nr:hypothetical protein B0T12DRAFT_421971 [Alternaria alternata]